MNRIKKNKRLYILRLFSVLIILFTIKLLIDQDFFSDHLADEATEEGVDAVDIAGKQVRQAFSFIENRGQWQENVSFLGHNGQLSAWFENTGITLRLESSQADNRAKGVVVQLNFHSASDQVQIKGEKRLAAVSHFFHGKNRLQWQRDVNSYQQIMYQGLYEGIDMRIREAEGLLEYDLMLAPGADLKRIVIQAQGINYLETDAQGNLLMHSKAGIIRQKPPKTWVVLPSGETELVNCAYRLIDDHHYGFAVHDYNRELALVIDPGLEWSTLLGGSSSDRALFGPGMVLAENGDVILTGWTYSSDFPTTIGAYDTSLAGDAEVFISRLRPTQTGMDQLIWSTYLGGSGYDRSDCLTIDEAGNIWVGGRTSSTDYPTTTDAYDTSYNGDWDGFITGINSDGNILLYSTFIGGSKDEAIRSLVFDKSGQINFTGWSVSTDFPVTSTAYDTSQNGDYDIVAGRLMLGNNANEQLTWSTFFGSHAYEYAVPLVVDNDGSVIISGYTESADLPTVQGAYQSMFNGGAGDGFVARFDPEKSGTDQLLYSSYLGGSGDESINCMNFDGPGRVLIAGSTTSSDFPVSADAYDDQKSGLNDAFICLIDLNQSNQNQLIYSTYIGGGDDDYFWSLARDSSGLILALGYTWSGNFPTTLNAYSKLNNGSGDAVLVRLDLNRLPVSQLDFSTYLGGSANDYGLTIAVSDSNEPIICGYTASTDFPTTDDAYQPFPKGQWDFFAARYTIEPYALHSDTLYASLDGNQAVPRRYSPGEGKAMFYFNAESMTVHYEISLKQLNSNINGISINAGRIRSEGPIYKTIFSDNSVQGDTTFTGSWTSIDSEPLTEEILKIMLVENLYVIVTTDKFPNGELRGQIVHKNLAAIARAEPGKVYATLGKKAAEAGSLVNVDPASGAITIVGPTGIVGEDGNKGVPGLAINSRGEMFATNINGDGSNLYRIDALTGKATLIGNTGITYCDAIAFDRNDLLYGMSTGGWFSELFYIDEITAAATVIAPHGPAIQGLAFDPTTNILYGSDGGDDFYPADRLFTIDDNTAHITYVGKTGLGGATPDLFFDEEGNLFGFKGGGKRPNDLIAIDKQTGKGTIVGPTGFVAVAGAACFHQPRPGAQIALNVLKIIAANTVVGQSSVTHATLSNYGMEDLNIASISDPGSPFTIDNIPTMPLVISPRDTAGFDIRFTPFSTDSVKMTLTIHNNDSETPQLGVSLIGLGVTLNTAEPGTWYASTGSWSGDEAGSRILQINPDSGRAELIGMTGLLSTPALAINSNGDIFAAGGYPFADLYRIDAETGTAVLVGSTGLHFIESLAFDAENNLYGCGSSGPALVFSATDYNFNLYLINTENGATSIIGYTGKRLSGLAFNPLTNILWASEVFSDAIYTLDISTAQPLLIGQTGLEAQTADIAFDRNGNLFATTDDQENPSDFISIDKQTGAGTVIGSTGFKSVAGLAFNLDSTGISAIKDNRSPDASLPKQFALFRNYPNPFNPSTVINYDLPRAVDVRLDIYDILGRQARTLVNEKLAAGHKQAIWDGTNDMGERVSSGVYIYRLRAGNYVKSLKLVLIR